MRKKLILLLALVAMAIPSANAETREITAETPTPQLTVDGDYTYFEAKGTPVVIKEVGGKTVATWEGGSQELNENTIVVGGYYNPCASGDTCSINLSSTSITMESGTIRTIIGGNLVSGNPSNYTKIYSGNVNITMTGGTVTGNIFGLTSGSTALGGDYYSKIKTYYFADTVTVNINGAKFGGFYGTSSYTYVKTVNLTMENAETTGLGLNGGANGIIDTVTFNVKDSKVLNISSGLRTMIGTLNVNASGTTTIADVYAGTEYTLKRQYASWGTASIGGICYGQVSKMNFNFGENVTYNNIYAGFQFIDKENFETKFATNGALPDYAAGLKDSENAPVNITVTKAPKVTDSELISMFDSEADNVKITFVSAKSEDIPTVDTKEEVKEATVGATDTDKVNEVLADTLKTNADALAAIKEGKNVSVGIEVKTTTVASETKEEITKLASTKSSTVKVANYFDISVVLKADDEELGTVSELSKTIELAVVLPTELQTAPNGYTRKYYIIREHDGKVEFIDATLSEDGKTVVFNTDKFSTYALAYDDVKDETAAKEDEDEAKEEVKEDTKEVETVENPKTGDSIVLYVGLACLSLVALIILVRHRKLS